MESDKNIINTLKQYGLRLTKTRQAVLQLFFQMHTPLSAMHVLRALEKNAVLVNKTTVYRELERLETAGIIFRIHLQDRREYYELHARPHHHHLVCLACERVEDVDIDDRWLIEKVATIGKKIHFSVLRHSLEFYGHCAQCLLMPVHNKNL